MESDEDYTVLVNDMIQEIRELELEIISLRYLLSTCMKGDYKEYLRNEIYTNTDPSFRFEPEYERYVEKHLHGKDPFDTRSYRRRQTKQAHGYIEEYKQYHPNMCLDGLSEHLWVSNNYILDL